MVCGPGQLYFGNGNCNYPEAALKYAFSSTEPVPSTTIELTTEVITTTTPVPTTTTTTTTTTPTTTTIITTTTSTTYLCKPI